MMNKTILTGTITEFKSDRGFGRIIDEKGNSYFFHISDLPEPIAIEVNKTKVEFKTSETPKGTKAIAIHPFRQPIGGEFSFIPLPNKKKPMSNEDKLEYLQNGKNRIKALMAAFEPFGITWKEQNGWLSLDTYRMELFEDPLVTGGHLHKEVAPSYADTAEFLLRLLNKQIGYYNKTLLTTERGIKGEEDTLRSLSAFRLKYEILRNVRLEIAYNDRALHENETYSSESDIVLITPAAVFVIETKYIGSTGSVLEIMPDGRCLHSNPKKHQEARLLPRNPIKQVVDHVEAMEAFFHSHDICVPVIPLIASANDGLQIEGKTDEFVKFLNVDMVGVYLRQYLQGHPGILSDLQIRQIRKLLEAHSLPPKTYQVYDYEDNIRTIVEAFKKLALYYSEDVQLAAAQKEERRRELQRKLEMEIAREEERRRELQRKRELEAAQEEECRQELQRKRELEEQAEKKAERAGVAADLIAAGIGLLLTWLDNRL